MLLEQSQVGHRGVFGGVRSCFEGYEEWGGMWTQYKGRSLIILCLPSSPPFLHCPLSLLLLDSCHCPSPPAFGLTVLSCTLSVFSLLCLLPSVSSHSHILFSLWPALSLSIAYSPSQHWGGWAQ